MYQWSTGSPAPVKIQAPGSGRNLPKISRGFTKNFLKIYIIILENEGFRVMKVTIFFNFRLQRAMLVKKWVSGLIINTNFKNLHYQQDYNIFLIFK